MTDTMLEKAARALAICAWRRLEASDSGFAMMKYSGGEDEYAALQWRLYAQDAVAVLSAIREPDEAMKDVGGRLMPDYCPSSDDAASVFTAMIDTILAEKP